MDNICRIPNNDEPPQGDEFDDDYEPNWWDIEQQKKEQAMMESFKKIVDEKSTKPKKKYRTIRVHPETLRRLREKNEKQNNAT
jgi:hypothetical protein|tara:strand:+ start:809 stop:1057 length:249 start_codon:yes stop_codon:yes gene_type:complete